MGGWATYSPGRPGDNSTYVIVFGCDFTSGNRQKTTFARRWATYPPGRPGGSSAYAIVFGCDFTSASEIFNMKYTLFFLKSQEILKKYRIFCIFKSDFLFLCKTQIIHGIIIMQLDNRKEENQWLTLHSMERRY